MPDPAVDPVFQRLRSELAVIGQARFTARDHGTGIIRHIVLFRYGPQVTAEEKTEVARRFLALADSERHDGGRYIRSIEAGTQSSAEGAHHGFEHAFVVTFESAGDRNYYVGRPLVSDTEHLDARHDEFKSFVGPYLAPGPEGVLVFDLAP